MSPNDLIEQLQEKNFDYWLELVLSYVPENIDKREGSIIYDAVAPAAMAFSEQVLQLANIVKQTYVKTAQDEFLDYRATEYGTARYPATYTKALARAVGDTEDGTVDNIRVGDRFASVQDEPVFYKVTYVNENKTFVLTAETAGSGPNSYIGQVLPVTPNDRITYAEIIEVSAPARDTETDDHLRARLLAENRWAAYGGNVADYLDMLQNIEEVGAGQVYPVWAGAGTVKLVILDNDLKPASKQLCHQVKEIIDPEDAATEGYGLAPIDHRVTVTAPEELVVNVETTIVLDQSVNPDFVKSQIKEQLVKYFTDLRRTWADINRETGRGYSMQIYRSKMLAAIMLTAGVYNAQLPTLNGSDSDINLTFTNEVSQLPILGEVVLNEQ